MTKYKTLGLTLITFILVLGIVASVSAELPAGPEPLARDSISQFFVNFGHTIGLFTAAGRDRGCGTQGPISSNGLTCSSTAANGCFNYAEREGTNPNGQLVQVTTSYLLQKAGCSNALIDTYDANYGYVAEFDTSQLSSVYIWNQGYVEVYCCPYLRCTSNQDCIDNGHGTTCALSTGACSGTIPTYSTPTYTCNSQTGTWHFDGNVNYGNSRFCSFGAGYNNYVISSGEATGSCYTTAPTGWCTVPPTCSDGIQNQGETGIDCGGPCNACIVATCSDGIQNQGETGIDCGGPCNACATCKTIGQGCGSIGLGNCCSGLSCSASFTGNCIVNPTCSNGVKDQGETGIDCGGPCNACGIVNTTTNTSLVNLKKLSLTKAQISTATNDELFVSACLTTSECLATTSSENSSISCISIASLRNDGTLTQIQSNSFFSHSNDILNGALTGAGIGTGLGVIACVGGNILTATGLLAEVGVPLAVIGCPALLSGGTTIGGAVVGASLANAIQPSDTLVKKLQAKDANSVGICTAEPKSGTDFLKILAWFDINGDGQKNGTDGMIIGGILLVFVIIILLR